MSDNSRKKSSGKSGGSGGSAMSKKLIIALALFALVVVILIFSGKSPKVSIDLLLATVSVYKSLAFLGFTLAGVIIGVLLK